MFTSIPRFAHRCYHVWVTRTSAQKRNAYGALLQVDSQCCDRCKAARELVKVVCEAPRKQDEQPQLISA